LYDYPVLEYPAKVNSLSLDKTPFFRKTYWNKRAIFTFEDGSVFNIQGF
jgi:hypothetical protein